MLKIQSNKLLFSFWLLIKLKVDFHSLLYTNFFGLSKEIEKNRVGMLFRSTMVITIRKRK